MVTVEDPAACVSALDVAVTTTCAGLGTVEGAMERPLDITVPHADPTHPCPLTDHVTAVFDRPETVAENCCWPSVTTRAEVGVTLTLTVCESVTVAVADWVGSLTEVAVTFMNLSLIHI